MNTERKILEQIFYRALEAVDPGQLVREYSKEIRAIYQEGKYVRLNVVGFGKAAYGMAKAVEDELGDLIASGTVITKYGHSPEGDGLRKIKLYEAAHPVPDQRGFSATEEIIKDVEKTGKETLTLCLTSGGGSSLFVSCYDGITLDEKCRVTAQLLKAGADINELNTVRKHISRVKGGRFAELVYPSSIINLIVSDVIGDRLDVIASGPTAPDPTTFGEAVSVLEKYGIAELVPSRVMEVLTKGRSGTYPETPKAGNPIFKDVHNTIVGSNKKALEAAVKAANSFGFETQIISCELDGEAGDVGTRLAGEAIDKKVKGTGNRRPLRLISGGETTVTVRGRGKGGRNTELALAFALQIKGIEGIILLSAGTDGTDGPTDAAGAVVNGDSFKRGLSAGLDPLKYLENNDSYTFFKKTGDIFITGPTGTNVMDIQIMVVE